MMKLKKLSSMFACGLLVAALMIPFGANAQTTGTTGATGTSGTEHKSSSLGDLLRGAANKAKEYKENKDNDNGTTSGTSSAVGAIGSIIKGLTQKSDLDSADLAGTWKYKAPAVAFRSENFLQKAGGAAAAKMVENRLGDIYQKARLQNLTVEFTLDHKFVFRLGKAKLSGTYARNPEGKAGDFLFNFKTLGGRKQWGATDCYITKSGNSLSMTFDISKLVQLASGVSNASGISSLKTITKLLESYDGVEAGFEVEKIADAETPTEAKGSK